MMDTIWYPLLMPKAEVKDKALFEFYHEDQLQGKLVVSRETNSRGRQYSVFPSHVTFFRHISSVRDDMRVFHEIIGGQTPQKLRFDLDVTGPESEADLVALGHLVKNRIISNTLALLVEMGQTPNLESDLSLYSSHKNGKRSYHIIFHRYCHSNCQEARAFYNLVMERIEPSERRYVDPGIYSRNASLRTLWSHKLDEPLRPKRWVDRFSFQGLEYRTRLPIEPRSLQHRDLMTLSLSLVTFTSDCVFLPSLVVSEPKVFQELEISQEQHQLLEKIIQEFDPCLQISGSKGSLISLKRLSASWCQICQREHEAENPYCWVVEDKVFYNCRRAPSNVKLQIGVLEAKPNDQTLEENPKIPTESPKVLETVTEAQITTTPDVLAELEKMRATFNISKKKQKILDPELRDHLTAIESSGPQDTGVTSSAAPSDQRGTEPRTSELTARSFARRHPRRNGATKQ